MSTGSSDVQVLGIEDRSWVSVDLTLGGCDGSVNFDRPGGYKKMDCVAVPALRRNARLITSSGFRELIFIKNNGFELFPGFRSKVFGLQGAGEPRPQPRPQHSDNTQCVRLGDL